MPAHSSTKLHGGTAASTKSKRSVAGGAERVGGKKVNGGAAKAFSKNQDAAADYLYTLETAPHASAALRKNSLLVARVSANTGSGVKVILETQLEGKADPVFIPFAKSIRFHGHAATKTDRVNCMCAHDIILVDGGFARAKFSPVGRLRLRSAFSALGVALPAGFFAPPPAPAAGTEDADDEDVIAGNLCFDRTEQTEEEAAAEADRVADAAARARKNRTADSRRGAAAREDARTALVEQLAALEARRCSTRARLAAAAAAEEEEESVAVAEAEPEAAGADRSAPNRAERRSAKLARLDLAARKARCSTLQEEVDAALAASHGNMGTPEECLALLAKSTKTLEFLREERAAIREEEEYNREEEALRRRIAEQEAEREAEMEAEIRATRGAAELPEAGDWEAYVDGI